MSKITLDRERTLKLTRRAGYQLSVLRVLEPGGAGINTYAGVCQALFALQDPTERPLLKSPEDVADHLPFSRFVEAAEAVAEAINESEEFAQLSPEKKSTGTSGPSPESSSG